MALVVVSGQPSSGKSEASAELKKLLQAKGQEVYVIDEPSLQLLRNDSYKGEPLMAIFTGRILHSTNDSLMQCSA